MTTFEYIREQQGKKNLSSIYKRTGVDEQAIKNKEKDKSKLFCVGLCTVVPSAPIIPP
jgi:hypothetical protein